VFAERGYHACRVGDIAAEAGVALHGAEHRAIAAAEERTLVGAWTGSSRPTRYAQRCGTNFAGDCASGDAAARRGAAVTQPAALVPVVSLALSIEIWHLVQESRI